MNKTKRTVKVDLFRSDNHKKLFNMMKDHLSITDQVEALNRLMFMSDQEVRKAKEDFQAMVK
jgi:hypothetical protein